MSRLLTSCCCDDLSDCSRDSSLLAEQRTRDFLRFDDSCDEHQLLCADSRSPLPEENVLSRKVHEENERSAAAAAEAEAEENCGGGAEAGGEREKSLCAGPADATRTRECAYLNFCGER